MESPNHLVRAFYFKILKMKEIDITVPLNKILGKLIIATCLLALFLTLVYTFLYGSHSFFKGLPNFFKLKSFLPAFLFGTILHELLHGVFFIAFGQVKLREIKFGINFKALSPYAHCKVPINITAYRLSVAAPGILLGIIPFIIALVLSNVWLAIFGIIFTVMAMGDFYIIWILRNYSSNIKVKDHETNCGCYIIEE